MSNNRYNNSRKNNLLLDNYGRGGKNANATANILIWDISAIQLCKAKIQLQENIIQAQIDSVDRIAEKSILAWTGIAGTEFASQLKIAKAELTTFKEDVDEAVTFLTEGTIMYIRCDNEVMTMIKAIK